MPLTVRLLLNPRDTVTSQFTQWTLDVHDSRKMAAF